MSGRRDEGIRPGLWALALFCAFTTASTLYLVATASDFDSDGEVAREIDEGAGTTRLRHRDARERRAFAPVSEGSYDLNQDPVFLDDYHDEDGPDPQMQAMERWMGPTDAGPPLHFNPTYAYGQLTHIEGLAIEPGALCSVRLLPVRSSGFSCLIRVVCDSFVLYPDPDQNAGYVACNLENGQPTTAVDDGVSGADGDPTVSFDQHAQWVTVTDQGPGVPDFRAEIELVGPRRM